MHCVKESPTMFSSSGEQESEVTTPQRNSILHYKNKLFDPFEFPTAMQNMHVQLSKQRC